MDVIKFSKKCKPPVVYRFYCMALYHSKTRRHMINRHIVGIPVSTKCALVADLFYNEIDSMLPLSDNNQTDVIEALNPTSRYLDNLPNIYNSYFENK